MAGPADSTVGVDFIDILFGIAVGEVFIGFLRRRVASSPGRAIWESL